MSLNINIEHLGLIPIGEDNGGAPNSVLLGKIQIDSVGFHVEAVQVVNRPDGGLTAVNTSWEESLEAAIALSGSTLTTVKIDGRDYVLTIYPFAR